MAENNPAGYEMNFLTKLISLGVMQAFSETLFCFLGNLEALIYSSSLLSLSYDDSNFAYQLNGKEWPNSLVAPYDCHGVSNYWQFDPLINSLFRLTAKETSKLCITGPFCGKSTGDHSIPSHHKGSIIQKIFPWHDVIMCLLPISFHNRPVAQTLQCTSLISHNAPLCNRNVHTFLLQNGALWDIFYALWDLWDRFKQANRT